MPNTTPPIQIRQAVPEDFPAIASFDHVGKEDESRLICIEQAITNAECWSVVVAGSVVGYMIINNAFYSRPFLSLLYIAQEHRNRGLGREAIKWAINKIGEGFFVSTNLSNARMLHMLRTSGFQDSGIIYNLDPGDPEVIFYYGDRQRKQLSTDLTKHV